MYCHDQHNPRCNAKKHNLNKAPADEWLMPKCDMFQIAKEMPELYQDDAGVLAVCKQDTRNE